MRKRVLVTGSNGFIGSHLVERLIENGCEVKCMVRKTSNLRWLNGLPFECIYADFRDPDSLQEAVKNIDRVYHLGGTVRVVHKNIYYEVNSGGTRNLIEAIKKVNPGIKKFVYVSSQAAWGPLGKGPVSHYGRSKAEAEEWAKKIDNYSIVRPVSVYGPRDRDFLPVIKMAAKGFFLKPRAGVGKLSFIYISDCVDGILNAEIGKEQFLSDGKDYTWDGFRGVLENIFSRKIRCIKLPKTLVKMAGMWGTVSGKLKGFPEKLNYDKVKEIFGGDWIVPDTPVKAEYDLESGFTETINWYTKTGWL